MPDLDWNALKVEYISGNLSLKALAEKHGMSLNTLEGRSRKEKWGAERQKYRGKVTAKALAHAGAREARRLEKLQKAGTRMCTELERLMADFRNQMYIHVAVEGCGDGESTLVSRKLDVVDDKKLLNTAKSIDVMSRAMRNLYDIQTAGEKAQLEMAREELELKRRAQAAKEAAEQGGTEIRVEIADPEDAQAVEDYTE